MSASDIHYLRSSYRENVLEHLFIGEILKTLWLAGIHDVEVLRAEVDDFGYDLVIECNNVIRHIQLKSTLLKGKASRQNINIKIEAKPSGCVVWMRFDPQNMKLGPFYFLGGAPGKLMPSLGNKIAKRTTANAQGVKPKRKNIRTINKGEFLKFDSMEELVGKLFGDIKSKSGQAA